MSVLFNRQSMFRMYVHSQDGPPESSFVSRFVEASRVLCHFDTDVLTTRILSADIGVRTLWEIRLAIYCRLACALGLGFSMPMSHLEK